MTHILLIILTISIPNQEVKDLEFEIPYSSKKECLKASEQIDLSSTTKGKVINTKTECVPKYALEV